MKKYAATILFVSIAVISLLDYLGEKNFLTGTQSNIVWFFCILILLYSATLLCTDFHFENSYFKSVFYLFITYQGVIFFRGVSQTNDFLSIVRQGHILWALFIPLFVFFDKALYHFGKIFNILYAFAIIFLVLTIVFPSLLLNRQTAEAFIPSLAIGCGFLFLNAKYLSNKIVNVSFFVLLISALSYTYFARRSGAFTLYVFLFAGYVFNLFSKSGKYIFKILPVLAIGGIFFLLIPNSFSKALLKKMDERLLEDTRTSLFDEFYRDMNDHMIFGKGMNGTYYYPMEESIQDDGTVYSAVIYRNTIENGYLQLLLSGGILHIILFVLLLVPASLLGIFNSSNVFARACGLMILLWLIDMFMFGLPTLSIHYVLIWICVGICFKKSIREKSDEEIYIALNTNYFLQPVSEAPNATYRAKKVYPQKGKLVKISKTNNEKRKNL